MNIYLVSSILFFTALLSGVSIYLFNLSNKKFLKLLLAFSGAFLFSIAMLNILPEIYEKRENHYIGIFIIIGFLVQLLLDYITHEIGRAHV